MRNSLNNYLPVCLHVVQRVTSFARINVCCVSHELLIIVLNGLFRGVIVVNHCFNYSCVYLQFVQPVSSFFANKCFLCIAWIIDYRAVWTVLWWHRLVMCAIHCDNYLRAFAYTFAVGKFGLECVAWINWLLFWLMLCNRRVMRAIHCYNHRDAYAACKNLLMFVSFVAWSVYIVLDFLMFRCVYYNALVATIRLWLTQRVSSVRLNSYLFCLLLVWNGLVFCIDVLWQTGVSKCWKRFLYVGVEE